MSGAKRVNARTPGRAAPKTHAPSALMVGATGDRTRAFLLERFQAKAQVFGRKGFAALNAALGWIGTQRATRLSSKRLRVLETVSLGEKRFAALLSVDGAEFLIGGSGSSVAMLASLDRSAGPAMFATTLQQAGVERAQC